MEPRQHANADVSSLWSIGHSTREAGVLVAMLREAGIGLLVDVRRHAGSRRNPQFGGAALRATLEAAGIGYLPLPALGGRRAPASDSPDTGLRAPAMRGYAGYMRTAGYAGARDLLMRSAERERCAMMCAEADWRDCHRGLIADDFKARGWEVVHLQAPGRSERHPYTVAARIVDGRLAYPPPDAAQARLFD